MNLIRPNYALTFVMAVVFLNVAAAQTPSPTTVPADHGLQDQVNPPGTVSGERKAQAYSKLMEGQRYLWKSNPLRSPMNGSLNARLAKTAFQRAVELDPTLAEGYTALAELALSTPPNDVDEAINLSALATKIEPDNFGSHRILARLYTFKSRFNSGAADKAMMSRAVVEWKEVTRLDPRNAEAWAFLSEFYYLDGKTNDQISALKEWVASSSPIDSQFYRRVMGGRGDLTSGSASTKLGMALIAARRAVEAVTVMSEFVADNPENADAIDILQEALESAGPSASGSAVNSLSAAVFANPGNVTLVNLLAQLHARAGRIDDAIKVVRDASERVMATDRSDAAALDVILGDLFGANDRASEAIASYDKALSLRGIQEGHAVADRDREFVMQVFDKMIRTYKGANRMTDVKAVIERARKLLGKDGLFADRQVIALYRETGRRQEALAALRAARAKFPNDYGLLRLEASILTESGMVDEGVALIKNLINNKSTTALNSGTEVDPRMPSVPALYDDFTNYLFISNLFNQANRGNDAREAANQAYALAGSEERKQLARLNLATTQQNSGDFVGAETTLREILKRTPGNPIALNNLGYFLLERNERLEEALGLIQRALKIDPTNPSYLDSLGWAHFMLGNLEEAERNLRTAARIDYGSETIHEHLGDLYNKRGKVEQARSAWQRAMDLAANPKDVARLKTKLQR